MGLANAFLNIVAFTLFIYDFNINKLPFVYLAIAVVLIVLNFFYEKIEHKFLPAFVLKTIIGAAIAVLIMMWIGLSFGNTHEFIFVLLVSNTVIYMVTGYAFWGLVALLFNVRESRRVFSIVGSGDIPSKLIGYALSPLLIPLIGLPNLVWLSIASLTVSLVLFHRLVKKDRWVQILKKTVHDKHEDEHAGHHHQNIVSFFFDNRLIFVISLLSILSYNVYVLIDYTFISEVKLRFEKISDLAIYIAVFFAVGRVIAIFFKLIFTSRVIENIGVVYSLFITPVALFVFCMLFFLFEGHDNYNVYIFGLMALLTEVLRSSMQEPVFFILFQPLKEKLRLKGHLIAKGYTLPPSLIVVGLSLLLFYNAGFTVNILFLVKILLINLVIWVAVVFLIQKAYLRTLRRSIEKGIFNGDDKFLHDQKAIDILVNKVKSGKESEVIYALDLLKKSNFQDMRDLLHSQLQNSSSDVRKYAIGLLEEKEWLDTKGLKQLLQTETNAEVKQRIVAALCRFDDAWLEEMAATMQDKDFDTRKTIIINLLNHHEFKYLLNAGNEINSLINSEKAEERKLAISIINELKHVQFAKDISKLMNDENEEVRRAAVAAACRLKVTSLLPQVFDLANHPSEKHLAIKALLLYGDQLFEDIQSIDAAVIKEHTAELVKICTAVKGEHSRKYLESIIPEINHHTGKIIHALWVQDYEPGEAMTKQLHTILDKYLASGNAKINDYETVHYLGEEKRIVQHSIVNEVKFDLVQSLKICSLLHRNKNINRILELIDIEKQHKLFNAIEMIELELPRKIAKDIIRMFDFMLDPHTFHKREAHHLAGTNIFNKVQEADDFSYNAWTKSLVMYCSWKNRIREDTERLQPAVAPHEEFIITETKSFILNSPN